MCNAQTFRGEDNAFAFEKAAGVGALRAQVRQNEGVSQDKKGFELNTPVSSLLRFAPAQSGIILARVNSACSQTRSLEAGRDARRHIVWVAQLGDVPVAFTLEALQLHPRKMHGARDLH